MATYQQNRSSQFGAESESNDAWLYKNVDRSSGEIDLIDAIDLNDLANNVRELSHFKTIGSYNWAAESRPQRPVIIVPGRPSTLATANNLRRLRQLRKKGYKQFIDESRFHQPNYPLESLFRAVQVCSPEFNFAKDTDIVCDRNSLRKLAKFAYGRKEKFRVDIQKVGNLVLIMRHEKKSQTYSQDYGKDFEVQYTTNARESSYNRVVSYSLGSIRVVMRFELDCAEQTAVDSVTSSLYQSYRSPPRPFNNSSNLLYVADGQLDKSASLVELTTKSKSGNVSRYPDNKINQMLFSKTETVVIGWHNEGALERIEKLSWQELCDKCNMQQLDVQFTLSRLSKLLAKLKEIASRDSSRGATLSVVCTRDSDNNQYVLKVFKQVQERQNLPNDLIEHLKVKSR